MKKPISTKAHGAIDYMWAATAAALPRAMDGAEATSRLVRGAAAAATASSLLTKYELGAMRVLPMKAHLALDFAMGAALVSAPLFLPASERRYAMVPVALGLMGLLTGLMTQTRSPLEQGASRQLSFARQRSSTADQNIDMAMAPHLRHHLE